ncbi:FGGY-family carbohydrate kinase [Pararhizobium mangrovi]|uniref:FGGY-family carbohydrate kinase n=1 Tax=Pararhizobium mangrovi TaxID=2590452 RepID=A0A506UBB4_9HYPH|nr:FGGY-family carbohydrate kinase [Pararhizobium mangrovi]TPW30666.1 FGGY-family carbohydrate kinase [Pararhizobium mangrovi]
MAEVFIGVDVGTGSARAGIFTADGALLATAKRTVEIWREPGEIVEQSSEQIWQAVCASVKEALGQSGVEASSVAGIGFDATCSLVVLDPEGQPLAVGPSNDPARNVMVWMDHRAAREADEINATGHPVLRYVGGRISPEMETPKLLWLKRNRPDGFASAGYFFDLADYLTFRATGSLSRSACTVTCKWTYLAHERRWDPDYFRRIGLEELADEDFRRIGTDIVEPGSALGTGLTGEAGHALGLPVGTAVGAALIDAHAGGVGTLGSAIEGQAAEVESRLAYIFGTSACSMASTREPAYVDGVWGPYYDAMIPGLWLNEGGQSAAGAAIDHLVTLHPAAPKARRKAEGDGLGLTAWLERRAREAATGSDVVSLARGLHVVPEFLGNRSPFAEPDARAVIAGLGLDDGMESLVSLYVAGLCGVGYGLRQLLDRFAENGVSITTIVASGGAAQSDLVRQVLADTTGVAVAIANAEEPVLLGSAMLAAAAGGHEGSVASAMTAMSAPARLYTPAGGETATRHDARYAAFEKLQAAAREIRNAQAAR